MLPGQRVLEQHVLDVLLVIVEEPRHDRREDRRGRQLLVTGILQTVEHVLQRLINIDGCQLTATNLIVMRQVKEELPGIPAVITRHMVFALRTGLTLRTTPTT